MCGHDDGGHRMQQQTATNGVQHRLKHSFTVSGAVLLSPNHSNESRMCINNRSGSAKPNAVS